MIRVITDSTADLSPQLCADYRIEKVPLYVYFGNECFRDGIDFSPDEFWQQLKTTNLFPRTAQPSPLDFIKKFRSLLAEGKEILFIGIASTLSGTVASAMLAKKEFPGAPIEIIDSKNVSMGTGLLCIHAAEAVSRGLSLKQTAEEIRNMVPRLRTSFIVKSLDYLYKGGRLSRTQALCGNILNIIPRIQMREGQLKAAEKIRGRERAVKALLNWVMREPGKIDPRIIAVTHCDAENEAEKIAQSLRSQLPVKEVVITKTGTVISSHCGPGTVGIGFIEKQH